MTSARSDRAVIPADEASGPFTREERYEAGRSIRKRVPRVSHGEWAPAVDRPDPISLLERQNTQRLPELVPIRMGRMVATPFAFLRGSATVMAHDLASTPVTGIPVQASGDCHVMNFGLFGTQERNLVFGMNDFDETHPGPWEWDVKRMAASAVVAARHLGGGDALGVDAVSSALRMYRMKMAEFAALGNLQLWYTYLGVDEVLAALTPDVAKRARALVASARSRTNLQVFAKMTELVDGDFRIIAAPPLVTRVQPEVGGRSIESVLQEWLNGYRSTLASDRRNLLDKYRLVDAVRKVVGVGSVGTRCFVILMRGEDENDPLFLQVKEAPPSVLEPFAGRGDHANNGKRVVEGQRLLQPAPDIFLGWGSLTDARGRNIDYYVRQLRDMKGGVTIEPGTMRPTGLIQYSGLCGWALALAHARSGDASMISGYLGKGDTFDQAIARFAVTYANQTEADHAALLAAIKSGRVHAESDGGS
jgi:uncharacterized protein (DUF2252 family)